MVSWMKKNLILLYRLWGVYKMKTKRWIQKADVKKERLHHQLHVPEGEKIPATLLNKVMITPVGSVVHNPTKTGSNIIHITPLLKKRVNFALNVRK